MQAAKKKFIFYTQPSNFVAKARARSLHQISGHMKQYNYINDDNKLVSKLCTYFKS